MREIKFRGYAIPEMVGNQWQYGLGFEKLELSEEYALKLGRDNDLLLYTERGTIEVHEKSVGQYTGLKDKNGVEIFEGDMVRGGYSELMVIVYDERQCKFKSCPISAYKINAGNGGYTGRSISTHLEIVGNIYEHSHLLNQ